MPAPAKEPTIRFFKRPADFRVWLEKNHAKAAELWVGFRRKGSGQPSLTWPESVDEALCFGWIDGLRKSIDESSYKIRFTPRKPTSIWSAVNIGRMAVLTAEERMRPAGLAAFAHRHASKSGVYSHEQRREHFDEPYATQLRKNVKAAAFFDAQPPSYRRSACWWVVSAKQEATRLRRIATLVEDSAQGRRLAQFTRLPVPTKKAIVPKKTARTKTTQR